MKYKFFCMILLQGLFLFGGDDYSTQPARSVLVFGNSVSRLRSAVQENQDRVVTSNKQEMVNEAEPVNILVQLVRTLASRVEELELKEELNNSLYKQKFRTMEREIHRQSLRISDLEKNYDSLYGLIDFTMEDALKQIRLNLKKDLSFILQRVEKQKMFMTLEILKIQEQMGKTSAHSSPPSIPLTVRGSSDDR